jgi:hypothetical protein
MVRLKREAVASLFGSLVCLTAILMISSKSASSDTTTTKDSAVYVRFDDVGLPASDLSYQGKIQDQDQAIKLQNAGVDLSTLEPDTTEDIYKGHDTSSDSAIDNALSIQNGDTVAFQGVIGASSGHFKFNVQTMPAAGSSSAPKTMTLLISTDAHTYLLRKELLRKLGYFIPGIKWLPKVTVRFPVLPILNTYKTDFLKLEIPNATAAAASRWQLPSPPGSNPNDVILQDVLVMEATPLVFNVAMGAPLMNPQKPTQQETARTIRALAPIYSLVSIPESINQVDWSSGHIQNNGVDLDVTDQANFATTLDDAKWILQKIAKLTREDFTEIVANAHYPDSAGKLLIEKLIARRNSLLTNFKISGLDSDSPIAFNNKISQAPDLKDGKLLLLTQVVDGKTVPTYWPGYASHFAWGDPPSPLQGLGWYGVSELESNGLANFIAEANSKLPQLTQAADFSNHVQNALIKYFQTGTNQLANLGLWTGPVLNGSMGISRDIVLGNYMGNNNLVQLADTFSVSATAGFMIGVDGLPTWGNLQVQGLVSGNVSLSLTHLHPLDSLKAAVTAKLQDAFVPWIFYKASSVMKTIESEQNDPQSTQDQITALKNKLSGDLDLLKNYLPVGDTMILTKSLNGSESITAAISAAVTFGPALSVTPGANQIVMSRIQFTRTKEDQIQIFEDGGELNNFNISMEFTTGVAAAFPVLNITAKSVAGSAKSKIWTLDITPDWQRNPDLFPVVTALDAAFKTGSVSVLDNLKTEPPYQLQTAFKDSASSLQFFHYMHRTLKLNGDVKVTLPGGATGRFFDLTDGKQSGTHYQNLATQAATYLIQRLSSGNSALSLNTQASSNPGQSFLGHSQTRDTEIQGNYTPAGIDNPLFRIHYRWEGWSISAKDVGTIVDGLSAQYGFKLFPDSYLADTQNVQMYEVSLFLDIYEAGLSHITSMSGADLKALEKNYGQKNRCDRYGSDIQEMSGDQIHACASMFNFEEAMSKYSKDLEKEVKLSAEVAAETGLVTKNPSDTAYQKNLSKLQAQQIKQASQVAADILEAAGNLEQFVSFPDLVRLIGGTNNLYVYSNITGFREGSEIVSNNPINSNSYGSCHNPNGQPCSSSNPVPNGVLDEEEGILGIQDGEFKAQWLRDVL